MKNLIVVGHPDKKSFCYNGIFKTIETTLNLKNEIVHVIDLYQENISFNFGEGKIKEYRDCVGGYGIPCTTKYHKMRTLRVKSNQKDLYIKELGLERTRLVAIGARRELDELIKMYDAMPHFTRQQIDESQPDYWQARLSRQANLQVMAGGAGWAHLEALDQIGVLQPMIQAQQERAKELQQ